MKRWFGSSILALLVFAGTCVLARGHALADALAPVIERVEPSAGPPGTLLRISGRRLRADTRVLLGNAELAIELSTPTLITARLGPGAASSELRLESSAGSVQGPRFNVLPVPFAPLIRRVSPQRAGPGTVVSLEGEHFSLRLAENDVRFGEQPAIVNSATASQLQVVVPDGAGSVSLHVRVLNAGDAVAPGPFEIMPKLSVQAVLPPRAAARTQLTLRGTGFDPDPRRDQVTLNGKPLRVLAATPTELRVLVPDDADSGKLRVAVAAAPKLGVEQSFIVLRAPSIVAVEPPAGPVGTELVLRGQGFGDDAHVLRVSLGDQAVPLLAVSPNELRVRVPAAAHSGKLTVVAAERGQSSSTGEFIVTVPLVLRDVKPRGGPIGSDVVLVGLGFSSRSSDQQVLFNGVPAQLMAATDTALSVRVPQTRTGPVAIRLGTQRVESRAPFVVTQPPRITQLSAEQLPPSAELRVLGSGFGQNAALVSAALAGLSLRVVSVRNEELVVQLPAEPTSGELSVHVALQGAVVYPRPIRVVARP